MSRHEGVSCDSCMRSNFRGRRFKCLICYDYDLCSSCYEQGASTPRHSASHPMQCILTRTDSELFFGGDRDTTLADHQHSFTCPFCGKMGFTEVTLQVSSPAVSDMTGNVDNVFRSTYLVFMQTPVRRWSVPSVHPSLAVTQTTSQTTSWATSTWSTGTERPPEISYHFWTSLAECTDREPSGRV